MWKIGRLSKVVDRSKFDCGRPELNKWLRTSATQYEKRDLCRVYVAVQDADPTYRAYGYYSLSSHLIEIDLLPPEEAKRLPRLLGVPTVLLGQFGVDVSVQKQGLGQLLLMHALTRVVRLSEALGIQAIVVDALDETAREFYIHHGFRQLQDDRQHLFLLMRVGRQLIPAADDDGGDDDDDLEFRP